MTYQVQEIVADKNNLEKITSDIVELFLNADQASFEIQGELNKQTKEPNVLFMKDPLSNTILYDFIKHSFGEELENIDPEEEKTLQEQIYNFVQSLKSHLVENHMNEIQEKIASILKAQKDDIGVEITDIELCDYSSFEEPAKYTYKIEKEDPDKFIDHQEIANFIADHCQAIEDVKTIFQSEKGKENPVFDNIKSISPSKRFLFNLYISMIVQVKTPD